MVPRALIFGPFLSKNEPQHGSWDYPTMTMSSYDHGQLIKGVRSKLNTAGYSDIKLVGYDHNWDTPWYATNFLNDPAVQSAIDAVAFHCYGGNPSNQMQVKNQFPNVEIMFTECTEHGNVNSFNGDFRWALRTLVIETTRNWASTVIEWNLVLAFNGPKTGGGCDNCRGLIDVDNSGYTKNPAYYALGHLSKFLQPGAHRISSTQNGNTYTLAMQNPDTSSFVIVLNDSHPDATVTLEWMYATCTVSVPSWSAVTVFRDVGSYTMKVYRTTDQNMNERLKYTEDIACTPYPNAPTATPPSPTSPPTSAPTTNQPSAGPTVVDSEKPTVAASVFPSSTPSTAAPVLSEQCSALIQQLQDDCGITV